MVLNSFYQLDTRYFHLSGKFEWLIHYLLLVMNDLVFLIPLKCQFCTICDIFLAFNMKNDNKISLKWSRILFTKQIQGIFTYPTSLNDYFTTFCILFLIILVLNPLKKLILTVQLQAHIKKIGPIENFHCFVFYQSTYSTLRKCKNWLCLFLINIYLFPGGGCNEQSLSAFSDINFIPESKYVKCISRSQ